MECFAARAFSLASLSRRSRTSFFQTFISDSTDGLSLHEAGPPGKGPPQMQIAQTASPMYSKRWDLMTDALLLPWGTLVGEPSQVAADRHSCKPTGRDRQCLREGD